MASGDSIVADGFEGSILNMPSGASFALVLRIDPRERGGQPFRGLSNLLTLSCMLMLVRHM